MWVTSGMAWCSVKSHVSELEKWMFRHSKKKTSVWVELRAGGDPHRSDNTGWSAGDMRQWPKKIHRHPVSPNEVLQILGSEAAIQEAVKILLYKNIRIIIKKKCSESAK